MHAKRVGQHFEIVKADMPDGSSHWLWFEVPVGMDFEQALESQPHHGPFPTEREAQVDCLGPQCKVTDGGRWDSAWEKSQ